MSIMFASGIYPGKSGCDLSEQIAILQKMGISKVEPFLFWGETTEVPFLYQEVDRVRIEELRAILDSSGMEAVSYHGQYGPDFALVLFETEGRDMALANVRKDMQVANMLGVSQMVVHAGSGPRGCYADHRSQRLRLLTNALIDLSKTAENLQLSLVVENMSSGVGDDMLELVEVIEEVNSPHVGICLDVGHANINGDPVKAFHQCLPHLFAIHLHDNDGQNDDHSFPFTCTVDEKRFIAEFASSGFSGSITLEVNEFWKKDEGTMGNMIKNLTRLDQLFYCT